MKKIALFSLITLSLFSFAFVAPPPKEKDKGANKLLKEVSKKYKNYKSLKADFTMINEPADPKGAKKTEKGTIYSKGNNFRLLFGGQEIFCNGKFIWTYTKENKECIKDNYNPNSSGSVNPAKIFTIWEKGFLYAGDGNIKRDNKDIAKIKLTPQDKSKPYFLMNLEVDQAAKTVQTLKISFKAGNKQLYTVTSQVPNAVIADKSFEFNPADYPGVEYIDLTKKSKK